MSLRTAAEVVHVAVFGLLLPWAAFRTRARFDEGRLPRGRELFVWVAAQLVVFGAIAGVLGHLAQVPAWSLPTNLAPTLLLSVGLLGAAAGSIPWRWRRASVQERERLVRLLPRERRDASAWVAASLCAGIAEELAYRGVLTAVLARWTGSLPAAAVLSALAFALAHAVQGRSSMAVVFAFALGFQGLVVVSGSLLPAMAVHAAYDIVAGLAYARLAARPM